jgi:hypothetical protein
MSSFLDAIAQDSHTTAMLRAFATNPFRTVIQQSGGSTALLGFNLDCTFVRPKSLTKLQKHVKYVPFGEISARLTVRTYFTIACICEVGVDSFLVSDLRSAKHVLRAENFPPLNQWDVIAIANAEIRKELYVRDEKQILRIGTCETVTQCTHAGDGDRCCVFIDSRNGPTCDHHCRQMFVDAGKRRMFLRQNTRVLADVTPQTSPERLGTILDQPPLPEVPAEFVSQYLENHANGRGAKFMNALKKKSGPTIAAGFKPGDVITL